MKLTKNQKSNLIFLAIIAMLLFTPVGKYVKIWVNRLFAFSPSITAVADRKEVSDYSWKLQSLNGVAFNLATAKGDVIVLNFWATWCPPCIAEMPGLQKLYDDYKDKVTFVFVSDEKPGIINDFLAKNKYTIPVFNPVSNVPKVFSSRSIPATYIIDKKGKIVITKFGAADWNSKKVRALMDDLLLEH